MLKCLRRMYISTVMTVFVSHYSTGFMANECVCSFLGVLWLEERLLSLKVECSCLAGLDGGGVCSCLHQKAVASCWISGPAFFGGVGWRGEWTSGGLGGGIKLGERNKTDF